MEASVRAATTRKTAPHRGAHLTEWLCELVGTAILLFGGITAIVVTMSDMLDVPARIPSVSVRLLVTGLLFAGTGTAVVVSPLGRRSGGHLNPVVTLAFRVTGHVHRLDLIGYAVAQLAGACAGAGLARLVWRGDADEIGAGRTLRRVDLTPVAAVAIEALMTAILVGVLFAFVSSPRTVRFTPIAAMAVVTVLVWQGAPLTGTSLNPARSLGSAVAGDNLTGLWIDVAGPVLGALAVSVPVRLAGTHVRLLTAKLCHDPRYSGVFRSRLPMATARHPGALT